MNDDPKKIPIIKVFNVIDEAGAAKAASDMVETGFGDKGFKVLMPKEKKLAKRIGYTVTTGVVAGLSKTGQKRNIRYWTYHEDAEHYAIVLAGPAALGA